MDKFKRKNILIYHFKNPKKNAYKQKQQDSTNESTLKRYPKRDRKFYEKTFQKHKISQTK